MSKKGRRLQQRKQVNDAKIGAEIKKKMKADGWSNLLAGLGGKMDKRDKTFYSDFIYLEDEQLSNLYVGDGLGKKIVNVVADDMTRQGITLEGDEDDKVMKEMEKLSYESNYNLALKWMRLFGGSIIFIGAMDGSGDVSTPLNVNNIKSIEWIKPIERSEIELSTSTFYDDPAKPNFGKVELYDVRLQTSSNTFQHQLIHSSRTVSFFGEPVPMRFLTVDQKLRYWGTSTLQAIWEKLRDMGGVMGSVANVLYEFTIKMFKFENLAEMLAAGNEKMVTDRMEIISMTMSMINAILLGKNEDFDRNTANLGSLPEVIDRFMVMLSAVTEIPENRLFGKTPSGLSTDDKAGETNYYDMVKAQQRNNLQGPLQYLVFLISSMLKIKEVPIVKFNPLKQMTPKQESEIKKMDAETEKIEAETSKIYIETGVLTAEEVEKELEEEE